MLLQSAISPSPQHFLLASHSKTFLIRSHKHSYGATLSHEPRRPINRNLQEMISGRTIGSARESGGFFFFEDGTDSGRHVQSPDSIEPSCNLDRTSNGQTCTKELLVHSRRKQIRSNETEAPQQCQESEPKADQNFMNLQIIGREVTLGLPLILTRSDEFSPNLVNNGDLTSEKSSLLSLPAFSCGAISWLTSAQMAQASEDVKMNVVYEVGELFELGIQLSYLLLLLGLLGAGTFFVLRQVLVRRELDLSAKELQEQVRSGDASATELFELGAVMLRRKVYPAAKKYLLQAIEKWDGDDQDLAQVYNALGVSYVRDEQLDKGITQFETAVKLQPGYVTAWNNLGDAYEKKKELKPALKAFEEVLLFDPNNKIARPRRDALKDKVQMYKGVPLKPKQR